MAKKIRGEKRSRFLMILLVIVLALVALAVILSLFGFKPLYAPSYTIVNFMSDVQSAPVSYTIAIADDASSEVVAAASDFASATGITNSKLKSELTSDTKVIYIRVDSGLSEEYKVVYYADKDSLLVTASNNADLSNTASSGVLNKLADINNYGVEFNNAGVSFMNNVISVLTCSDGTQYESCGVTKPKYCEVISFEAEVVLSDKPEVCGVAEVEEDAITAERTMLSSASVGDEIEVTFTITSNKDGLTSLAVGELVPVGFEIVVDSADPEPVVQSGGTILWTKSTFAQGTTRTYTYRAEAKTAGIHEFKGKAAVLDGGVEKSVQLNQNVEVEGGEGAGGGETPGDIGGGEGAGGGAGGGGAESIPCSENWQCGEFGACSAGTRTRICTDLNNCGTIMERPPLSETCVSVESTCVDTDGGFDIFTSGSVNAMGVIYNDMCNASGVLERACNEQGQLVSQMFACAVCKADGRSCETEFSTAPGPEPTAEDIYSVLSSIENTANHGYRGLIGKNAQTIDSIGMIDLAGKFKISQTKTDYSYDNDVSNVDSDLIIVGGPCVNMFARELYNNGKFAYGCSNWPGGGDFAVAEFVKDGLGEGKDVVFIAGTRGSDTREMARLVKQYKDADKEAKFKAGKKLCKSFTPGKPRFCQDDLGLSDDESL